GTASGQVLTTDGAGVLTWTTPSAGFTDPLTTRGDIIYRDATSTTRLAKGAANEVLTSNGTDLVYTKLSDTNIAAAAGIAVNKLAAVTASKALVSDGSGFVSASSVSDTELGYLAGSAVTNGGIVYGNGSAFRASA